MMEKEIRNIGETIAQRFLDVISGKSGLVSFVFRLLCFALAEYFL